MAPCAARCDLPVKRKIGCKREWSDPTSDRCIVKVSGAIATMGLGSCIVSANQWFATTRVRRLLLPFLSLTGSLSSYTLLAVILL